jgi:hypothetical protein
MYKDITSLALSSTPQEASSTTKYSHAQLNKQGDMNGR